jgi:hypothetical protein
MKSTALILSLVIAANLHAADETLTVEQRLQSEHLKNTNEARSRFAKERKTDHIMQHGLFEDLRAILDVSAETEIARDEILAAAKKAGVRVVLFADPKKLKPEALRGERDGVLYFTASESGGGLKAFFTPPPLKFLPPVDDYESAKAAGFAGLQLCNRDKDQRAFSKALKDISANPAAWKELVENTARYPDEVFAASCDHRWSALERWDREIEERAFVAVGAQPEAGRITINGTVFDPYEISFRHQSTHILAREFNEADIRRAIREGNMYVAHDWLCDPTGFVFGAASNFGVFPMGDPAPYVTGTVRIVGFTPVAAQLKLIRNGAIVEEKFGSEINFTTSQPGTYRLEAWLKVDGEERPWIYSNPVYLKEAYDSIISQKLPTYGVSDKVELKKDITYADGKPEDADKHKLDIYAPKGKPNAPVLFFVHGGAWRTGDRSHYLPLGNRFASEGLLVVAPSYRLAPKNPYPAQIDDVAAAFAWTVKHIKEHGGDPERIYVSGHSAGGHLVSLLTLDPTHLEKHKLSPKFIKGTAALSGVYDLTAIGDSQASVFGTDNEFRRKASPLTYVNEAAPKFLVTYCQWDYMTLPAQAKSSTRR